MLAPVAIALVDGAVTRAAARVARLLADAALEEALAALAADGAVVAARGAVPAHHARLRRLRVEGEQVALVDAECDGVVAAAGLHVTCHVSRVTAVHLQQCRSDCKCALWAPLAPAPVSTL